MHGDKGYSLVELLAALAILAVVIGVGYSIYLMSVKGYTLEVSRVEVQQNVRSAASYIQRKLLTASEDEVSIEKRDGLETLKVKDECFNLKDKTLRVNLDCESSMSPFNPLAEGIEEFTFRKDGKKVEVTIGGGDQERGDYFAITFEVLLRR
ncbi:MAG: hypothetical protein PWR01_916 [Clostridiales bacterium]|jgi:prepilin-type N-terminal cleavage/methylation domain-containing protein|nr:hypothetical protein [Clostridiales bacterium]